jgi:hypothetical protein
MLLDAGSVFQSFVCGELAVPDASLQRKHLKQAIVGA